MSEKVKFFRRQNGQMGASYRGVLDTGYDIYEDGEKFTVWGFGELIVERATEDQARAAVAEDWDQDQDFLHETGLKPARAAGGSNG